MQIVNNNIKFSGVSLADVSNNTAKVNQREDTPVKALAADTTTPEACTYLFAMQKATWEPGKSSNPANSSSIKISNNPSANHVPNNSEHSSYINMIGSEEMIDAENIFTIVSQNIERTQMLQSAEDSTRAYDAAGRAGNKMISSAQDNLTGVISGGVVNIGATGLGSYKSIKALNEESGSIERNLGPARTLKTGVANNEHVIDSSPGENMTLSPTTRSVMSQSHADDIDQSISMEHAHNKIQIETNKARIKADALMQGGKLGQGLMESGFNVSAAGEQKQAELARADREVNNALADVQTQIAKRAAEARATMNNAIDSALNNNSAAISGMADRT
ncbi:invasin protein C (IpaC_SipC) [Izhakiella capsodis]|uniref:Invasin protein C (IpaC_SipC) n=1 Tax=Izhakiella capsodis TaxID=1367852 RepID=A0A1I5AWE1_9GAMM|nr:IpaC/SipC family type III secretion system effector [Izhakiella capsodis]SFN66757.1 invasin protein C (IpaC_SipC) [Izhakiella capsodis]